MPKKHPEDHVEHVALADLTLEDLRSYRNRLTEEEERVSYWRRLVQARLDVLTTVRDKGVERLTMRDLVQALGSTGTGARRQQLLSVHANDDLPPLPELGDLWSAEVDPADAEAVQGAVDALQSAEQRLTTYRKALHARIDEATAELIVRYRGNPDLSLALLPEDANPETTHTATGK